jgi:transaldolase
MHDRPTASSPLQSLVQTGTKLWLDSIDPELIVKNRTLGATGATSNPIIIADLVRTGQFDDVLARLFSEGFSKTTVDRVAWQMTDRLVRDAQHEFHDVWRATKQDDGYVSFELDPLLEDAELAPPHAERVAHYVELGRLWSAGHENRLIKVPATPAGIDALEELAASGVKLNVTLLFTSGQYRQARDAIWRGARRLKSLDGFKSVYSIFISRVDVYTEKHVPQLSQAAQGQVGIVGAKRIWRENREFWADKPTPLAQEIVFASTGTKRADDPPWKYVEALAGSDIQTNPPATNDAVEESGLTFMRTVDRLPSEEVLQEIDAQVDQDALERFLVDEGARKFADPHKELLQLLEHKRAALM